MKIVIAGAGNVGIHLAKLLAGENQDIVLIDESPEKLARLDSSFDLLTIQESPVSLHGLKEAGAGSADLFVAVTTDESRNLISAQLAHHLGAKKTVARINNYEYLQPKHMEYFNSIGLDSLIYPDNAQILNKPLAELGKELPYHIVAILREGVTIIPSGHDTMQAGDLVYFMTMKKHIPHIRRIAGKEELPDVRDVIIMGGSRIAVRTAQLMPDYMNLKIIESDLERCNRLTELVDDRVMIINGDGRDPSLLMSEGIQHTEAFVALTDNSETNILACLAAKRFGVTKTIAEVENIDYINMAEKLDIGTVINKKKIAASHIYQMMLDADVTNVKCLTFANADVAEFNVMDGARITRSLVKDISLPRGVTIGGLIRNKEALIVTGNTQILPGDHVVVFCLEGMIKTIEKYFN